MWGKGEIGKGLRELTPMVAQARVDRLLSNLRERTTREMAEKVAWALLAGEPIDEIDFEELESLAGVEEAITHVIVSAQPRSGGNEDDVALAARATVENLSVEISDTVKRAGERVKAKEGSDLWVITRDRIADLICDETRRCPSTQIGPEKEDGRTDRESPRVHYASATLGPATCRRLGMEVLSEGNVHQDVETDSPQCADDYVLLANEMEPALAMREYQKALALDPNHVMAHFFLAEAFRDVGNFEAAVVEFTHVTRLVPDDPDGHWCLGDAILATGDLDAASREYATALGIAPDNEWLQEQFALLDPEVDAELMDAIHDQLSRMGK